MADSETQQPVDTTQQVTSTTPVMKQKNPKRVAAGKAIAERTKQAREAQKKNWPRLTSSSQTTSSKQLKLRLTHRQGLTHHKPKTFLQPHNG